MGLEFVAWQGLGGCWKIAPWQSECGGGGVCGEAYQTWRQDILYFVEVETSVLGFVLVGRILLFTLNCVPCQGTTGKLTYA